MRFHTRRIVPAMFATTALLLASMAWTVDAQYNPNVGPCPGQSPEVQGYASLATLKLDLASYFSSLTSPPTISPKPTPAPSKSPTLKPTRRPTTSPTPAPTVVPTKAPITFRPTRPPWWKPTVSPAPTIEIIIIGGGGGGYGGGPPSGPSGPSRLLNEEYPPAPSPAREDGLKRLRGHIAVVEGDYAQTDAIEEEGQQQGGDHSLSPQGRSHVASHLVDDGEPVHFPICPGTVFEFTASNPDYVREWNTPEWIVPTALPPLLLETPPRNPVIVACLPDPANGGNTRSCIFSGGTVQLLIDNSNRDDYFDYDYASYSSDESKLLTVSGLTFRGATFTSTLLLDPRSPVSFYDCAWQNNAGRAVVHVNGTYIEPYTTTTSTFVFGSPSSSTTTAWETGDRMLLGEESEDGEQLAGEGEEEEGASLDGDMSHEGTTVTASTVFDWGRLETFRDLEEVEEGVEEETTVERDLRSDEEEEEVGGYENAPTAGEPRYFARGEELADEGFSTLTMGRSLSSGSDKPRSSIVLTECSFSGNTADSTIVVTSYSDSSYQQNSRYLADLPHSINLLVEKTEFVSESVAEYLILNRGGRFKSSSCEFENNSAKSIIKSERGAVELRRAKFSGNVLTESIVMLDLASELERNEVNCAEGSDSTCDGIIISGVCQPFDESCAARDGAPEDTPEPTLKPSESPSISSFPTVKTPLCPDQYNRSLSLGDSNATFYYEVVPSPGEDRRVLCGRILSYTEGWIGFGISPNGTMEGGEAIIGLPDEDTVLKYSLGIAVRASLMPADKQTLLQVRIEQAEGMTLMEFAKYLSEEGENDILEDGVNTFLYALGSGNELLPHASRGSFTLDFNATASGGNATAPTPAPSTGGSNATSAPTPATGGGNATSAPTPAIGGGNATSAPTPATGGSNATSAPTPTPLCPDRYTKSISLGDSNATFYYAVVPSPGEDRRVLCGLIFSNTEGWIGFGISPNGTMEGGEAIIGLPDEDSVLKYSLGTAVLASPMPAEKQTLLSGRIEQAEGMTLMEFAKYLSEEGENEILEIGVNTFLYALGSGNQLGMHGNWGNFTLDFNLTAGGSNATTPAPTPATGGGNATSAPTPATGGSNATSAPTPATGGSNATSAPTPTPLCPDRFARSISLGDSNATFYYAVVPSQGEDPGILCGLIFSYTEGWIGFGISSNGTMEGGEAIIGLPNEGTVLKYSLGTTVLASLMPAEKQTLLQVRIEQADGMTLMQFAKYLKEDGENEILEYGVNTFLYALGSDNQLGFHGNWGNFTLNFGVTEFLTASPQVTPPPSPGVPTPTPVPTPSLTTTSPTTFPTKSTESKPGNDGPTKPPNLIDDLSSPTTEPTKEPSNDPTNKPTFKPSKDPTSKPTTKKPTSGGAEAGEDCNDPEKSKRSKKRCKARKKEQENSKPIRQPTGSRPTGGRPPGGKPSRSPPSGGRPSRSPPSGGRPRRSRKPSRGG